MTPQVILSTTTTPVEAPIRAEMASSTIKQLIHDKGIEAGLSEAKIGQIIAVVECESQFENVQSRCLYKNGERELSFGISQIHLPAHPNITKEQALDIEFAVDFIVNAWVNNEQSKWTCARKLGIVK